MVKKYLLIIAIFLGLNCIAFGLNDMGGRNNSVSGNQTQAIGCPPSSCGGGVFVITNFGATCNGNPDDGPAFNRAGIAMRAFQANHPGLPVTLIVPSGSNCRMTTCPTPPGVIGQFSGISNMTMIATGATFKTTGNGSCVKYTDAQDINPGFGPPYFKNFNTSIAGATCVTMTTPGDEAFFPTGRWVLVGGQGLQANSFPPNYAFWEYAQIASNGAGQVCFTAGLKNSYPSTNIVDLSAGNCSNWSCGGAGSLSLLTPEWGSTFHMVGGTWDTDAEIQWGLQTTINDNVSFTNFTNNCYVPSLAQTTVLNNVHFNCNVEVDKENDQITMNGGFVNQFVLQSVSNNTITLNGGAAAQFGGTPLSLICNNSTINGALAIGNSLGALAESVSGTNCNIGFIQGTTPFFNAVSLSPSTPPPFNGKYDGAGHIVIAPIDIFGGDFPPWLSTGGRMKMSTSSPNTVDTDNYFTVTAATNTPTNSSVATLTISLTPSFGASLPPANGAAGVVFSNEPARNATCSGCFGSADATDLNFLTAQNKPFFTYSNRTYTCVNNLGNVPGSIDINGGDGITMAGAFIAATINVLTADTNVSDGSPQEFVGAPKIYNTSTGVVSNATNLAIINLKLTGTRVVNPTSTTGFLTADSGGGPGANSWLDGENHGTSNSPFGVTNGPAAQCPVVSVEWRTTR